MLVPTTPAIRSTNAAAGVLSRNGSPGCVRIAVTPVRTASPSTTETCPTATPGTTVIAFVQDPDGYKIELIQRGS